MKLALAQRFKVSVAYLMGWDEARGRPPGGKKPAVKAIA
jgi:hypothetical protein